MKRVIASTFLLCANTLGHAASFDCSKARSYVEQAICKDKELSNLDDDLSANYKKAIEKSNNPAGIRGQQRAWIEYIRNQCLDEMSLKEAYRRRIEDFRFNRESKDWIYDGNEKLRKLIPKLYITDFFAKHRDNVAYNVEYCEAMLASLKFSNKAQLIEPIVVSGDIEDIAKKFPKCTQKNLLWHTTISATGWEMIKDLPLEERKESGTPWYMWRNFLLYKTDIDNNPKNGTEFVLYGAGNTSHGYDRADSSHFSIIDPTSCRVSSSAQVQDVIHYPDSFVGLLTYDGKQFVFDAAYNHTESSYSISFKEWTHSKISGITFFSSVCTFSSKK